ncbi:hypothetical protein QBC35DRAFT_470828 [Podospora australis]|uniref:Uncharacterized protein n=1 Tax=Podospora australis TaxID=1536484 RepID=A0AAN6X4W7_9PEZI|nr:hypothetical protein QBC35DRAFT_470828 [Podospora australis]
MPGVPGFEDPGAKEALIFPKTTQGDTHSSVSTQKVSSKRSFMTEAIIPFNVLLGAVLGGAQVHTSPLSQWLQDNPPPLLSEFLRQMYVPFAVPPISRPTYIVLLNIFALTASIQHHSHRTEKYQTQYSLRHSWLGLRPLYS